MTFRDFFSFPPVFSGFPGFFGSLCLIVKTCGFSIHRRIFSITETHLLLKRIFIRIFNRFFPVFLVLINNYGFFSNICINRIENEENIKYFLRLTFPTGFPGFSRLCDLIFLTGKSSFVSSYSGWKIN